MAVAPEFITAITHWSHALTQALPEAQVRAMAEEEAGRLQTPLSPEARKVAVSIAVTENAERIGAEINRTMTEETERIVQEDWFKAVHIDDEAGTRTTVTRMGDSLKSACMSTLSRYAPEDSHTSRLLSIPKISVLLEDFVLRQLYLHKHSEVKGLLERRSGYYAHLAANTAARINYLWDNDKPSTLSGIIEDVLRETPKPEGIILVKPTNVLVAEAKEAILVSIGTAMRLKVLDWLEEMGNGLIGLFSLCTPETKAHVLSAAIQCGFPPVLRAELVAALGVTADAQPRFSLEVLRNSITINEKYFLLVSLVMFFSEALKKRNSDAHFCHPARRNLLRKLVVNLLTKPGDIYPENEWFYIHVIEALIAQWMPGKYHNPARDLFEEWKHREASHDPEIEIFNLVQLTPTLYPAQHLTIAVSGWTSQGSDFVEYWKNFTSHLHYGAFYALSWEAGTISTEMITALSSLGEAAAYVLPFNFLGPAVGFLGTTLGAVSLSFKAATERAEQTGKCLAYHIKNRVFGQTSVTLVGFSLGAHVLACCLDALREMEEPFIQDVLLFGGATSIDGWANRKKAVTGRIMNFYSKNDMVLKYAYQISQLKWPVGRHPIAEVEGVENLDVTSHVTGHADHKADFQESTTEMKFLP